MEGKAQTSLQILSGWDVLGAFYSEKLPGLSGAGRVVVLNTNLYYSNNEQTAGMVDPARQFQWLEDVLTNASRAKEMVTAPASTSLGSLPGNESLTSAQTHPPTQDAQITEGPSSAWYGRQLFPSSQRPVKKRRVF